MRMLTDLFWGMVVLLVVTWVVGMGVGGGILLGVALARWLGF